MKADEKILNRLYNAGNPEEIAEIYNEWAKTYDTDLTADSDYVAPQWCLDLLEKYVPSKDA